MGRKNISNLWSPPSLNNSETTSQSGSKNRSKRFIVEESSEAEQNSNELLIANKSLKSKRKPKKITDDLKSENKRSKYKRKAKLIPGDLSSADKSLKSKKISKDSSLEDKSLKYKRKPKKNKKSLPIDENYKTSVSLLKEINITGNVGVASDLIYSMNIIDLNNIHKNSLFECVSVNSYVSAFDSCESYIFIGLKNNNLPFDILNFDSGETKLLVYNKNLVLVDQIEMKHGPVKQIRSIDDDGKVKCLVLFNDGILASFNYESNGKITDSYNGFSKNVHNFTIIEDKIKITHFDWYKSIIVFTDGFKLYKIEENKEMIETEYYNSLIMKIKIEEFMDNLYAFILDVNGVFLHCDIDFKNFTVDSHRIGYDDMFFDHENGAVILKEVLGHNLFKIDLFQGKKSKIKNKFLAANFDGSINILSKNAKYSVVKKLIQIVARDTRVFVLLKDDEFVEFKNERLYLPGCKSFSEYFVFVTENGLLMKVYWQQ